MGMLDSQLVLSDAQAVTAVGTTPSTNTYAANFSNTGDNGQTQENLWVTAAVNAAVTSGGAATMQAVLQQAPDNATWTTVVAGPTVALASLTSGAVLLQVQPPPGMQQYWRIAYIVGTAALTGGTFDAYISNTIQRNVAQPSGFAVV